MSTPSDRLQQPIARGPGPGRSFSRTYVRGETLTQAANIAVKAVGLANSFLVLSVLSVYHFGLYQLILSAVAVAESFSTGLFDDVAINDTARSLAEGRKPEAKRLFRDFARFKIGVGAAATIVLAIGAGAVSDYIGGDTALLVRLASALVLIGVIRAAQEIFFLATVSFSWLWTQTVQEAAKLVILGVLISSGGFGLAGVLGASVASAALALAFSSFWFIREYRPVFSGVCPSARPMLMEAARRYGPWVAIRYGFGRVIKYLRPWLVRVFISTEAVAIYALAVNLIAIAESALPIGMLGRLLPWEAARRERFRFIFHRGVKYAFWIGLGMAVGGFVFVPPLIELLLPKYAPAVPLVRVMLLILPLFGVYKIYKSVLGVLREQRILSLRVAAEAGIITTLDAILLPLLGVIGVAIEYAVTYAWRVLFFHRELVRAHPDLRMGLRSLLRFDQADRELLGTLGREILVILRLRPAVLPR